MYENHIFVTAARKRKKLREHVLCQIVFLNQEILWAESEKDTFLKKLKDVLAYLEKEAAGENVPLHFTVTTETLTCTGKAYECPPDVDLIRAKASNYPSAYEYESKQKHLFGADSVTTVFVCHGLIWRAYARGTYCVVDRKSDPTTILHELLHIYGAQDYYLSSKIRAVAEYTFPRSVMLRPGWDICQESIDPLARFLIGWKGLEPGSAAQFFLDQTEDITQQEISNARAISKNDLDYVFKNCKPFSSYDALEEAAASTDPFASFLMGLCYQKGIYVTVDQEEALRYFQQSFDGDCAPAGYALAVLHLSKEPMTQSNKAAAQQALASLQRRLYHMHGVSLYACCLFSGYGLSDRNLGQALSVVISNYNHYNFSSDIDLETQFRKLPETVQQHHLLAKLSEALPELYASVRQIAEEYAFVERHGDPVMFYLIGKFLIDGTHPRSNPRRGLELLLKAAQQNLSAACQAVANCCSNGIGTLADPVTAQLWEEKAKQARLKEDDDSDTPLQVRILNNTLTHAYSNGK